MEPLFLKSEDALYAYLKKFIKEKPEAKKLGSGPGIVAVFHYSVDDNLYKLSGDTTRGAVVEFLKLAEEHGSPALALREFAKDGRTAGVMLATQKGSRPGPGAFLCVLYTAKASDKLKKAA